MSFMWEYYCMTTKFLNSFEFYFYKTKDDNVILGKAICRFDDGTRSTEIFKVNTMVLDEQTEVEMARHDEELALRDVMRVEAVRKEIELKNKALKAHQDAVKRGMEKQKKRIEKQKENSNENNKGIPSKTP